MLGVGECLWNKGFLQCIILPCLFYTLRPCDLGFSLLAAWPLQATNLSELWLLHAHTGQQLIRAAVTAKGTESSAQPADDRHLATV